VNASTQDPAAEQHTTAPTGLMTKSRRRWVIVGGLLTMVLALLDQNIVTTAAWPIANELDKVHGLDNLPWLITVYVLAGTATQPLYGKLCDVFGPKRIYLVAAGLFIVGSALCGVAQNMAELIVFRGIQGLGGGGLMSTVLVIAVAVIPPKERGGNAGAGGVMVGLGMVLGPLLGGFLTDALSWRWIFYINLPLGVIAWFAVLFALRLPRSPEKHRIDYLGAGLVAAAACALLLVTEWGGKTYAWRSVTILSLLAGGVVLLAAFIWRQATAREPIFTLSLFRNATFRVAAPLQLLTGAALTGVIIYVALYLQIGRGISPTQTGVRLLPIAFGLVVASVVAGRLMDRFGRVKPFLITGTAFGAVAIAMLSQVRPDTPTWLLSVEQFLLGAGLGQIIGLGLLIVQNAVPERNVGVATTGIRFVQTLGGAIGAAMFGAILTRQLAANLPASAGGSAGGNLGSQLRALAAVPHDVFVAAFVKATDTVFLTATVIMVVGFVLALLLHERKLAATGPDGHGTDPATAEVQAAETTAAQSAETTAAQAAETTAAQAAEAAA
jgi:EmrB/QacA subfamily drug resistance transporter